ncbi:hypothetical protein OROGR_007267 [Orobanche gracilis]
MDPNNESDFDAAYNDVYNMILNDTTADDLARLVQQRRQQSANNARPGSRKSVVERGREEGHTKLVEDYFSENPVYTDTQFRRRFRMRKHVFLRIVESLGNHDEYFQMSTDATGRSSLSPLQKCTAAIRMLSYGAPADFMDEYIRIGETTSNLCLEKFVKGITEIFGPHYMRRPNNEDTMRLQQMGESRGFPGMLGSIDCMHWEWKNCPVAWKSQYCRGDHGKPTVMLEAVASQDLWIWHAFFGIAGSNKGREVVSDLLTLGRS